MLKTFIIVLLAVLPLLYTSEAVCTQEGETNQCGCDKISLLGGWACGSNCDNSRYCCTGCTGIPACLPGTSCICQNCRLDTPPATPAPPPRPPPPPAPAPAPAPAPTPTPAPPAPSPTPAPGPPAVIVVRPPPSPPVGSPPVVVVVPPPSLAALFRED